jgi:hypothetical protein
MSRRERLLRLVSDYRATIAFSVVWLGTLTWLALYSR